MNEDDYLKKKAEIKKKKKAVTLFQRSIMTKSQQCEKLMKRTEASALRRKMFPTVCQSSNMQDLVLFNHFLSTGIQNKVFL